MSRNYNWDYDSMMEKYIDEQALALEYENEMIRKENGRQILGGDTRLTREECLFYADEVEVSLSKLADLTKKEQNDVLDYWIGIGMIKP